MKKIILIVASVLVAGAGSMFFINAKSKPDSEYRTALKKDKGLTQKSFQELELLGFTKSENLKLGEIYDDIANPAKKKMYWDTYGVQFISDVGLQQYEEEHDLVIGYPKEFIGFVPSKNAEEMYVNQAKQYPDVVGGDYFYLSHDQNPGNPIIYISASEVKPEIAPQIIASHGVGVRTGHYTESLAGRSYSYDGVIGPAWAGECLIKDKYTDIYGVDEHGASNPLVVHAADYSKEKPIIVVGNRSDFASNPQTISIGRTLIDKAVADKRVVKVDPMVLMKVSGGWVVLTKWME